MTRADIDILWQRAMQQAVADGEMFTRYHFAALVAKHEREACIDLVAFHGGSVEIEAAIRARSST